MRLVAGLLFIVCGSASAWADALTKADVALLLRGEPVVRVIRDAKSKSFASGNAFAVIDIPTPPEAVFAALTDCERVRRYVANLVTCKVTKKDPGGLWEIRETEMRVSMALPNFKTTARLDYVRPKQIRFKQVEGNFDYAEGQWDLSAFRDGKATRVFYASRAGTSMPIPDFVIQNLVQTELPATLKALRAEAIRGWRPAKQ